MSKRYNLVVIGLGIMGRRMIQYMLQHDRFAVMGAWDPSADSVKTAKAEFPGVKIWDSAEAMIAAVETELVYIACPPAFHKHYADLAMDAGKPVYCEKPLGISVPESEAMVRRLEETKTPNVVNFSQASLEGVEIIEAAMKNGEMGEIVGAELVMHFSQWPRDWQADADWLRFRDQGGYTREVTSHYLYITERFLGRADLLWSKPTYQADPVLCETHVHAMLDCSGVPVSYNGAVGGVGPDRIEGTFYGTKKSYRLSTFYVLEETTGGAWELAMELPEDPRAVSVPRQIDNVARWMDGSAHTMPSAADALSVQKLVEGILAD
ncbi:MAG: Gfo/Idh/MocA family oxidoreductase [Nisaea sp.]|uniref:Gfo/Idh/MocA family protein n=1 Tax=Nisaea sp. TaxID=2024842 RepID=UPI001B10569D|nr:Gfo/Idh/MocA family oxidoreductase [Nisaea sp.]MBO6560087.1 Gfo/Idh/MocA family oxidoreductase [Nisaea sp.]